MIDKISTFKLFCAVLAAALVLQPFTPLSTTPAHAFTDYLSTAAGSNSVIKIDTSRLAMNSVLQKSATPGLLRQASILYTPGFSTYLPEGPEIAELHEDLSMAVISRIMDLDKAYPAMYRLNDSFNSNLEQSFSLWTTYANSHELDDNLRVWYALEQQLQQEYLAFRESEMLARAQAESLSHSLSAIKQRASLPVNRSLALSNLTILLMEKYSTSSLVYMGKYSELFPAALTAHALMQESYSEIPEELLQQLRPVYDREQDSIIRIIDCLGEIRNIEERISCGLDGLEAFHHEVLKICIARMEAEMPLYTLQLHQLEENPELQAAAALTRDSLYLYNLLLVGMRDIDVRLGSTPLPGWLIQADRPAAKLQTGHTGAWFAASPAQAAGVLDNLSFIARTTTSHITSGARTAYLSGKYVVNATVETAVGATRSATRTVQAGMPKVSCGARCSVAAFDVLTNELSIQFCGWMYGVDREGRHAISEIYQREHMEDLGLIGPHRGQESVGAVALDKAKYGLEQIRTQAGTYLAYPVEIAIGNGCLSGIIGYLGTTTAGMFTGLGEGIAAVLNPNSSQGEFAGGLVNIFASFVTGGSGNVLVDFMDTAIASAISSGTQYTLDDFNSTDGGPQLAGTALVIIQSANKSDDAELAFNQAALSEAGLAAARAISDTAAGSSPGISEIISNAFDLTLLFPALKLLDPDAIPSATTGDRKEAAGTAGEGQTQAKPVAPPDITDTFSWEYTRNNVDYRAEQVYHADGTVTTTTFYLPSGQTALELRSITAAESCNPFESISHGLYTEWDADGNITVQGRYVNGKKDGLWRWTQPDGYSFEETYSAGLLDGTRRAWYPDGQLWYENSWVDNRLHGSSTLWNEDGIRQSEDVYADNSLLYTLYDIYASYGGQALQPLQVIGQRKCYAGGICVEVPARLQVDLAALPTRSVDTSSTGKAGNGGGHP